MLGEILNYFHLAFIGNTTKLMVYENAIKNYRETILKYI